MKKIVLVLISVIIFSGLLWGTDIYTWENLSDMTLDENHVLKNNLDSGDTGYNTYASSTANSNAGWVPIGGGGTVGIFTGSFDGGGFTISALNINRPDTDNVGLFGHVGQGATIENVKLSNVNIKGARGTGSLIGRVTGNENTLTFRCSSSGGTVVGDAAVGGLIGSHNSYDTGNANRNLHPTLQESWADVDVSWSRKDAAALKFGGLVGCNQKGKIYDSYALGDVTVDNDPQVGGQLYRKESAV